MDIEKYWDKALKETEIIRSRVQSLKSDHVTRVPYILLTESTINLGDTVVRTGEVLIDKPALIVPPNNPMFSGFDFESQDNSFSENSLVNFLIVRGVTLPSLRYDNHTSSLDIFEGGLADAIKKYQKDLEMKENISTGLLKSSEECWQLSLLIFICVQVARNANQDIRRLMDEYRRRKDS